MSTVVAEMQRYPKGGRFADLQTLCMPRFPSAVISCNRSTRQFVVWCIGARFSNGPTFASDL